MKYIYTRMYAYCASIIEICICSIYIHARDSDVANNYASIRRKNDDKSDGETSRSAGRGEKKTYPRKISVLHVSVI